MPLGEDLLRNAHGDPAARRSQATVPASSPAPVGKGRTGSYVPGVAPRTLTQPTTSTALGLPGSAPAGAPQEPSARDKMFAVYSSIQDGSYGKIQEYDRLVQDDFTKLAEGTYDENQNWRRLADLAIRGVAAEDSPEFNEVGQQILHELKDNDAFKEMLQVLDETRSFEDLYVPPDEPGRFMRGFSKFADVISRPGRWGLGMVADIKEQEWGAAAQRLADGGLELVDTVADVAQNLSGIGGLEKVAEIVAGKDITGVADFVDKATDVLQDDLNIRDISHLDTDESGDVGFREAIGLSADFGEDIIPFSPVQPGHLLELGGQAAADPLSYVTLGGGGIGGRAASRGLDGLESILAKSAIGGANALDKVQADRLATIVAGFRSGKSWRAMGLTSADQKMVREALKLASLESRGDEALGLTAQLSSRQERNIARAAQAIKQRAGGGVFMPTLHTPVGSLGGRAIPGTRLAEQALRKTKVVGSTVEPVATVRRTAREVAEDLPSTPENVVSYGFKQTDSSILNNARVSFVPKIREAINPMIKMADRWGPFERALVRETIGAEAAKTGQKIAEFEMVVRGRAKKAINQVERTQGLKGKEARERVMELVDRVRKIPIESDGGAARSAAIEGMRREGLGDVAELIPMLDNLTYAKLQGEKAMGGFTSAQGRKLGEAQADRYSRRTVDRETDELMNAWKQGNTEEWQWILENRKPSEAMQKYLIQQGMLDPENAAEGYFQLFNRWTNDMDNMLRVEARAERGSADEIAQLIGGRSEQKLRTLFPQMSSEYDVNAAIADIIHKAIDEDNAPAGMAAITKFYDTDKVDIAIRMNQGYREAVMQYDILNELSEVAFNDLTTGKRFRPAVRGSIISEPIETPKGMQQQFSRTFEWVDPETGEITRRVLNPDSKFDDLIELSHGTHQLMPVGDQLWLVHEMVAEEMGHVIKRMKQGAIEGNVMRSLNKWNAIWAAHATVPLVGTAFHARNMLGNWVNMHMGGFNNINLLGEASQLQRLNKRVQKHMKGNGFTDWDDSFKDMMKLSKLKGSKIVFDKDDLRRAENLASARRHGVLSTSFFNDLRTDAALFDPDAQKLLTRGANKLIHNKFVGIGQSLGSVVENNARLAMYLDGIEKGMTPTAAAQHTKKYLFDYADLTPFEANNMRSVSRFYTWMRKNTALQARMVMSQPGSVWNAQRMVDGIMGGIWGDDGDPMAQGMFTPDWAQDANLAFSADKMMLHGYETPLMSAMDTVENLAGLVGALPYGDALLPEGLGQRSLGENVQASLGLLGSGPSTLASNYYELAFERDLFSQRPIGDSKYGHVMSFVEALLPSVTKAAREIERYKVWEEMGVDDTEWGLVSEHQEGGVGIRWLSTFLGAQVYQLSPDQQVRALAGIRQNYEDIYTELRAEGYNPPTMDELRDAGRIGRVNELANAIYLSRDPVSAQLGLIPAGFQEQAAAELGVPFDVLASRERTQDEWMADHETAMLAFENLIKRPLTKQEMLSLSLSWDNRPVNDFLEELGIGGIYEPVFPLPDKEAELAERQAKGEAFFEVVGSVYGLTEEDFAELRPKVNYWDRFYIDAKEAGMTDDAIVDNMMEHMGRARTAALFGVDSLEQYDWEKDFDGDELEALREGASWDIGQADLITRLTVGRPLTPYEAQKYVLWGAQRLTKGMQTELAQAGYDLPGLAPPVPNRDPYPGYSELENAVAGLGEIDSAVDSYFGAQPPQLPSELVQPSSQGQELLRSHRSPSRTGG